MVVFSSSLTKQPLNFMAKSKLTFSGRQPIPQNDIWIAAAAKEHDLPIATRDRHFSFVPGLRVLQW